MFLKKNLVKGRLYYNAVEGIRIKRTVTHKEVLYLGRLDNLTPERKNELEDRIRALGEPKLLERFWQEIYALGYRERIYPLDVLNIEEVLEYGPILAQHRIWEMLNISKIINRHTPRGGGKVHLDKLVEIQLIHRNCEPGSREETARWYPKTALPLLLGISPKLIYSRLLLRSLAYLQPKYTLPMQKEIYERIKEVFGIMPERVDVDVTSVYFEGDKCIIAEFGFSRDDKKNNKQIIVGVAIDQHGILMTHFVFPE